MSIPSTLGPGESLFEGDSLLSPNGNYQLILQMDGNLVLYPINNGITGQHLWASGTSNQSGGPQISHAIMQSADGNFVIYDTSGNAPWCTGSVGENSHLVVQDDGNVVIYHPIWSTQTNQPAKPKQ
jgi:hypothetical protein